MTSHVESAIRRYRNSGVLVDSNVLVVYFAGLHKDVAGYEILNTFKNTKDDYNREDFNLLHGLIEWFAVRVITPHILTEVSNMLRQQHEPARVTCLGLLQRAIPNFEECIVSAEELGKEAELLTFGVADMSIIKAAQKLKAAKRPCLVITSDGSLYGYLNNTGLAALKYKDIREQPDIENLLRLERA